MSTVIVGAGVIGLSIALSLRVRGIDVTLVDPEPGGGAARSSGGILAFDALGAADRELRLGRRALDDFRSLATRIANASGSDLPLRSGLLRVGGHDSAGLDVTLTQAKKLGIPLRLLDHNELRSLIPDLGTAVGRGVWSEREGTVDPNEFMDALLAAVTGMGGTILRASVRRLLIRKNRIGGVETVDGDKILAEQIIVCAGAACGQIDGLPGDVGPLATPVRGVTIDVVAGPEIRCPAPVLGVDSGMTAGVLPGRGARIRLGASSARAGWNATPSAGDVHSILSDTFTILPGLANASLDRLNIGFRPHVEGDLPVITPSATEGLIVVAGHYRSGVVLSGLTAELVADIAMGKPVDKECAWLVRPRE